MACPKPGFGRQRGWRAAGCFAWEQEKKKAFIGTHRSSDEGMVISTTCKCATKHAPFKVSGGHRFGDFEAPLCLSEPYLNHRFGDFGALLLT